MSHKTKSGEYDGSSKTSICFLVKNSLLKVVWEERCHDTKSTCPLSDECATINVPKLEGRTLD